MTRRDDKNRQLVTEKPFFAGEENPQPDRQKQPTGGLPSAKQDKTKDTDADRNSGIATKRVKPLRTDVRTFNLLVDGVPYLVRSVPFFFNDELRFRISINGNSEYVFTWDSELGSLRGIDDNAAILPDGLEEAISEKLQTS
jgi:hypothetical protein